MLQDKLQALLSTGQYGDVAKMLDRAELEVSPSFPASAPYLSCTDSYHANTPQSPNPLVLEDWPHAAHMLGHIYNKKL
jgi:hypothetical protein